MEVIAAGEKIFTTQQLMDETNRFADEKISLLWDNLTVADTFIRNETILSAAGGSILTI